MLVIKIELWKYGNPKDVINLGTMTISNDGTGTSNTGNYITKCFKKGDDIREKKPFRWGNVKGHKRLKEPVWKLVHQAIEGMYNV